ncbi:MAG: T9SS-dependent M36 family metallopeptidase [Bacteroidia bacterium]|nr:T9SS-dependent M36 family metallopeptidase [Bacteroidia bacterium]
MLQHWFKTGALLLSLLLPSVLSAQSPREAASAYLTKQATSLGLKTADIEDWIITDAYTSRHNGVTHIYLRQRYQGIEISQANLNLNLTQEGRISSAHSAFAANLAETIQTSTPSLTAEAAFRAALAYVGYETQDALPVLKTLEGPAQEVLFAPAGVSLEPVPVKLTYHLAPASHTIRLAWLVRIYETNGQNWWSLWVDATTGEVLHEENWIVHCSWEPAGGALSCTDADHLHHSAPADLFAPESIQQIGTYNVFPVPVESPSHGPRSLLTDPADPIASPFGWHDTNGQAGSEFTITRGNNVYAADDQNADNQPGYSPDGTALLNFDFPLDLSLTPASNLDAGITNLFYWNNMMHDVWYYYGFDEVSGNFQQNNYGNGGAGNDYVQADALDGSGTNNANFGTPPDGQNPRMQMFIWTNSNATSEYLTINSPTAIAGPYSTGGAGFGPGVPTTPLTADIILAQDGTGNSQGCNALTINATGKFVLADRGNCPFATKVLNAQNAGAVGVIIANNTGGGVFTMGGSNPSITIPSVMVSLADGNQIKAQLVNTVNGTMVDNAGGIPGFDSGLDNGVIAHEYTHGISTRLTGGPSNSGCLGNEEQAGEGWSDWFGLALSVKPGDVATTPRGIGTYLIGEPITGTGIRNYPYTTDMGVNPSTYDYIKFLSVPHGVGSVMCTMLWDLYWALVDEYGFDADLTTGSGGNNMAMQLVVDGLKLQPCSPGFVDVRDAILEADQLNYAGANQCLIWSVFARRGLGYSANQGSSSDRSDGVEGYDLPPTCTPILYMEKTASPDRVPAGDTITYQLTITNYNPDVQTNLVVTDTLPTYVTYVPGSATCTAAESGGVLTLYIDSLENRQTLVCTFKGVVDPNAPFSTVSFFDDMEDSTLNAYLVTSNVGTDKWKRSPALTHSGTQAWFVPNAPNLNDQALMSPGVTPDSAGVFSFWHWYDTETGWDGGFVEILPTLVGAWTDAAPYFIENGYDNIVGTNNPVGERDVFGGDSKGWKQSRIDLSSFAGQVVFVRFRFVSDDNTVETGWYLDDISLGSEEVVLNDACVISKQGLSWCDAQAAPTVILEGVLDTTTNSVSSLLAAGVRMYPNPASQAVTLEWLRDERAPVTVSIRNLVGQEVITWSAPAVTAGSPVRIPLAELARGVYIVTLQTSQGLAVEKLMLD